MAQVIDCAAEAERILVADRDKAQISILPSERVCMDGDLSWRIEEFLDPKEDKEKHFVFATLTQIETEFTVLRIHRCPVCGAEKRYGGNK
jgi:hypothetical protein